MTDEVRGRGLQRRLIRVRVRHARRIGLRRVYTYVSAPNIASMKSLVREGFEPYYFCWEESNPFVYLERRL